MVSDGPMKGASRGVVSQNAECGSEWQWVGAIREREGAVRLTGVSSGTTID